MIVDRERMTTELLASLHAEGRSVITILQTSQYRDFSSFSDVGTFVPLSRDVHGQIIRDLRRHVPVPLIQRRPRFRRAGTPREERTWWREGWQAIAAPAKETTAKLIPIVTTQETPTIDAVELAQTYIHRWPAQENIIKDYLLPLGLDTNHGFAKVAVENSDIVCAGHLETSPAVFSASWHHHSGLHDRAGRTMFIQ